MTDVGFGDLGPIAGGIKNMLARGQAFALSAVNPCPTRAERLEKSRGQLQPITPAQISEIAGRQKTQPRERTERHRSLRYRLAVILCLLLRVSS